MFTYAAALGAILWQQMQADERRLSRDLFVAALTRSHNLPAEGGYPPKRVAFDWVRRALPESRGYFADPAMSASVSAR